MDAKDHRSPLKPRARLMQHLGEDLIPNDRVALFELIKNSYDADASTVIVRFRGRGTETQLVEVWDDGHGMNESTVESNWLEIANPNRKQRPTSESGRRRVLGAKGLGRFAVARLATTTELTTRRADSREVFLGVNWDDFNDDSKFLDDVQVAWGVRADPVVFAPDGSATTYYREVLEAIAEHSDDEDAPAGVELTSRNRPANKAITSGTLLRLSPLRGAWTDDDVAELSRSLSRLTPPPAPTELGITAVPDFQIILDLDDQDGPSVIGPSPTIAKPAYRLFGQVDGTGKGKLTFNTTHAAEDETIPVSIPSSAHCGPLSIDLRVWDLESEALRDLRRAEGGLRSLKDVRELIRASSGVALYRDGFRVQPYGDSDVDWLNLDSRRVNNPTLRVSNNQLVGFVFTTADANPDLRDQANRQGLIQNEAFEALREAITEALMMLEDRRYRIKRAKEPSAVERERLGGIFAAFSLEELRTTIATAYPNDVKLQRAVEKAEADLERGVESVQEVVSRFSRLSTLGSLVDVMLHEGNTALASANFLIGELEDLRDGAGPALAEQLGPYLDRLQLQVDVLARLFKNLEPLSGRRRGRPRKVEMTEVVGRAVAVLEGELSASGVTVEVTGPSRIVTVDVADIMQIVINLVRNAIYWTATTNAPGERLVRIDVSDRDGAVVLEVSDNGPGVPDERAHLIFDAYYTTRNKGVGLGLNIAGSIAADFYDGELVLVDEGPLPGATFQVILRRRIG